MELLPVRDDGRYYESAVKQNLGVPLTRGTPSHRQEFQPNAQLILKRREPLPEVGLSSLSLPCYDASACCNTDTEALVDFPLAEGGRSLAKWP